MTHSFSDRERIAETLADVERLYESVPQATCRSCGLCCVTPTITLAEFMRLLQGMLEDWPRERLHAFLGGEMVRSTFYFGNHACRIQEEGLCSLYPHRPLICRLEGMPVLETLGMREERICPYDDGEPRGGPVTRPQIDSWVGRIYEYSERFYNLHEEPYWIDSLNVECWFAVALDERISQPPILRLRGILNEGFDLDGLAEHYADRTRLKEKLDLIDRFMRMTEGHRPRKALKLLERILYDFPRTGSHFYKQGYRYRDLLRAILRSDRVPSRRLRPVEIYEPTSEREAG